MAAFVGIMIAVICIAVVVLLFVNVFMKKRKKAENPCENCVYHECLMTHGVCDRLNKDPKNLR